MPSPIVTGISPKEGTPGTKVTIRGENLGTNPSDVLGVAICGKNCSLTVEWMSPSKIVCKTSTGEKKGDIIVITRSGGVGTCTVHFTGLPPKNVGPLESSPVWVDETEYVDQRLDRSQKSTSLSLRTDPLGLNSEDLGTNPQARKRLAEMFVKGSPDPTDENFVPSWFLLERHRNTPFHQLKEGHAYMKRKANRNTNNAPLNHVKDSLPVFFEVHETLSGIHHKMLKDGTESSNKNITDALEETLNDASKKANLLFETVLQSKDRADSIRNTLNVLQRFKFLFHLPLNIERNIQKGDYGVVINDYEKAKSLFADTDVRVFKKVYEEVEKRIEDFRVQLQNELQELPSPLARQKILIRHLIGLGDGDDPAWQCLEHQHHWMQDCMLKCKDKYLTEALKYSEQADAVGNVGVREKYLQELAEIVVSQIPKHWHLWQQYSTGVILSETGEKTVDVEKLKDAAAKHAKQMKSLLRDTVDLFVNLLRAAFHPSTLRVDDQDEEVVTERNSYGVWPADYDLPATLLSDIVRAVRQALSELAYIGLPDGSLGSLKDIIHDMRVLTLSTFLKEATEGVRALRAKEDWIVNNKGVTELPNEFNTLVQELLVVSRDLLQSLHGEEAVFARVTVQKSISNLLTNLFVTFANCIERTSFLDDAESEATKGPPPLEQRLVIGISNLFYATTHLLGPLLEQFKQLGFPNVEASENTCENATGELDEKLFDAYMEQRVEPLTGALELGMYAGDFDWNDCLKPTDVRPYIKTALMSTIAIHAEVHSICPDLVVRVMADVVHAIADELLRLMQCVSRFSANGAFQARLDIETIQQATLAFATPDCKKHFDEALSTLPSVTNTLERRALDDLGARFKSRLMFQLRSFE